MTITFLDGATTPGTYYGPVALDDSDPAGSTTVLASWVESSTKDYTNYFAKFGAEYRRVVSHSSWYMTVSPAFSTAPYTAVEMYNSGISEVQINSGKDSGTTTSGTSTTLTCSGKSWTTNQFANSVVWITGGTGVGQSRLIVSNTATVLTPGIAWETNPDATSTFVIMYRLSDVIAAVPTYAAWRFSDADSDHVLFSAPIRLLSGGALSTYRETMDFTTQLHTLLSNSGSYFQAGNFTTLQTKDIGVSGGALMGIIDGLVDSVYWEIQWSGKMRWYGTAFLFNNRLPVTQNSIAQVNRPTLYAATGLECYCVNSKGLTIATGTSDKFSRCAFTDSELELSSPPALLSKSLGAASPRPSTDGGTGSNGVDIIDHVYAGSGSSDIFLYRFYLTLFDYRAIAYLWNAFFPRPMTAAFRWYPETGYPAENHTLQDGQIYTGYLIGLKVTDAAGTAIAGVNVGVYDVNGDGAILTSKAANKTPIRTAQITTDASGSYTGIVGESEGLPILAGKYTRASEYVSAEVLYMPGTFKARKYGKRFLSKVVNYTERSKEQITLDANVFVSAVEVVAAAYTGIAANAIAKTLITSEAHTLQQVYDSSQSWAATDTSYNEPLTTSDGLTLTLATGWKFTPDLITWDKRVAGGTILFPTAGTYAPKVGIATIEFGAAGSYNLSGADIDNEITLTNSSGGAVTVSLPAGTSYVNVGPNITVSIPTGATVTFEGVMPGSEIRVYLPNKTEVAGVESCASNQMLSWDIETPPNNTVRVTIFLRGYRWHEFQLTPTVGSQAIPISQTADLGWTP